MNQRDDEQHDGEDTPTIDLDTPDQPNSWVAEVARRREPRRKPPKKKGQSNG